MTEVSLHKSEYKNGTVALVMNDQDGELYAVATVNLCHPLQSDCLAFLDENNLPGIGDWITRNKLGTLMGVKDSSGFCLLGGGTGLAIAARCLFLGVVTAK